MERLRLLIVGISLAPQVEAYFDTPSAAYSARAALDVDRGPAVGVIIKSLLRAIMRIDWIDGLLLLMFYIFGIMDTQLFGVSFPDWLGNVGRTMYTLFSIIILEAWFVELARLVMEVYPYAWLYFIPFILITPSV